MGQKMQVPGIIGGAGPGASSQLYLDIIARCRQAGVDRRPAVLMASLEIDLAMEAQLLETGEGLDGYLPAMAAAAQSLSRAGADFIVPGSLMFKQEPAAMRQWLATLSGPAETDVTGKYSNL